VLADPGGRALQGTGRARHARHDGMGRDLAHVGIVDLDQRFALQHIVVLDDLRDVVDRADGNAGLVEVTQVLVEIAGGDELADDPVEFDPVAHALDVGREARIVRQLRPADLDQHAHRHALCRGREADPASVLRLVDVARGCIGRAAAGAHLHLSGQPVVGGLRTQHREQRIEQRQVQHLAVAAVHLDLAQRHHHGAVAVECGHAVGQVHGWQDGFAVGETVHRGEAAIAFDQRAEARLVAIASVLAPPRDAHDHQPGVDRMQLCGRQAHILHDARPEALDQNGGCLRQFAYDGAAGIGTQVEGDALLVAAVDLPGRLDTLHPPRAQRVAFGRLDLDDLGAEVGELQGQHVAGHQARQVDDADPVQGAACVGGEGLLRGLSGQDQPLPTKVPNNCIVRPIAFFEAAASQLPRSSQWKP